MIALAQLPKHVPLQKDFQMKGIRLHGILSGVVHAMTIPGMMV